MVIATAVLAAAPALAKAETPAQLEMETWRAFQGKRVAEIKSLFAPNFVGLYRDGTHDLARDLKSLNQAIIQDYKITDMRSRAMDRDGVMLTYQAAYHLHVGSDILARKMWMASLWQRQGGRWLCVYHTEIPAK
jgi:hypothetical protein